MIILSNKSPRWLWYSTAWKQQSEHFKAASSFVDIILSWDIKSYDWKPEKATAYKIHLTSHSFLLILRMQLSYRSQEAVSQSACLTVVPNSRDKDGESMNKLHINQKKFHLPPQNTPQPYFIP